MENQNQGEGPYIDRVDPGKFDVGFDNAENPTVMVITVPLAAYAADRENGGALLFGKMKQAADRAANIMQVLRQKKQKLGVIGPDGKPVV